MNYTYTLTEDEINTINHFADTIDTSYYDNFGQDNYAKKRDDQFVGKAGEIAAYHYLLSIGIETTYPDFKIYPAGKKSWLADLYTANTEYHVKCCRFSGNYDSSWCFYIDDKHIFGNDGYENKQCIFCEFHRDNIVKVKIMVDTKVLHKNNLFCEPVKEKYKDTKKAVYYLDCLSII